MTRTMVYVTLQLVFLQFIAGFVTNIFQKQLTSRISVDSSDSGVIEEHAQYVKTFKIPFPISPTEPFGVPVSTLKETCHGILSLLDAGVCDPPEHFRLTYLISMLEKSFTPIQTIEFFNFASKGKWELMYSNIITSYSTLDEGFEFKITQNIESGLDPSKGTLINHINYSFDKNLDGILSIHNDYEMNTKGDLQLSLDEHIMTPLTKTNTDDAQMIVENLQKSIPFDIFDPNDCVLSTTYLDSKLRVVRMNGGKLPNTFSIWVKSPEK